MAIFRELEPPPKSGALGHIINWLFKLHRYIVDVASQDYWIRHAIDVIGKTYGDVVSVDEKSKDLLKFGRTDMPGSAARTTVEIHQGSQLNETFVTGNTIDYVVSTSINDTPANNRSDLKVEGHTVDGSGNFTFLVQDVALNGQTPVQLGTALARVTRVYNNDSSELQGTISVYDSSATSVASGVPATASGVHLTMRAGSQNSEKCSTTLSSTDYWIVTGVYGDVLSVKTENAIFAFEVRLKDKVFREYFEFAAGSGSGAFRTGVPYVIIPPNSDVRVVAYDDGNVTGTMVVSAGIFGTLAKIV